MEVKLKVCINSDEINQANSKNAHYEKERQLNVQRSKAKKVLVPANVEVPEKQIEEHSRFWDVEHIDEGYINEFHEEKMISVIHLGQPKMIIYSDETWEIIKKRLNKND